MADFPTLETRRLRIVPFAEEHLTSRYVGWLNDPDVVRYSEQRHRRHTLESCGDFWRSFAGTSNCFWAVIDREGGLGHIGNLTAYVDAHNLVADVGILLGAKEAWGRGHGTEAWLAACAYLFGECAMRKVTAGTLSVNEGMLRIIRKTGMADDGRRVRQCLCGGREVDMVQAAFFREDWLRTHGRGSPEAR